MQKEKFQIYCDESRQNKDRFMILGGLVTTNLNIEKVLQTIRQFRSENSAHGEFKWTKISNKMLPVYKELIDHFFALNSNNHLDFRCLIIDNHKVNNKKYNNGNKELGFHKFYFQLIVNSFIRLKASKKYETKFYIFLDEFKAKQTLEEFKSIINVGAKKYLKLPYNPCQDLQFIDSKLSDLIQINDILLGAVGWHKNELDKVAGFSSSKAEIANHIADKVGVERLGEQIRQSRFNVWNFNLRE